MYSGEISGQSRFLSTEKHRVNPVFFLLRNIGSIPIYSAWPSFGKENKIHLHKAINIYIRFAVYQYGTWRQEIGWRWEIRRNLMVVHMLSWWFASFPWKKRLDVKQHLWNELTPRAGSDPTYAYQRLTVPMTSRYTV